MMMRLITRCFLAVLPASLFLCSQTIKAKENVPMKLEPFAMTQVRLLDGSFKTSQDINRKYLDSLDVDSLLKNFRVNAGLPAPGNDLAGWEAPNCAIRGHFTGHYLSALALMYASTGDESLKQKGGYMVGELAKVQQALGEGYLSAFPKNAWDVVEAAKPNWAQYYTIHKIMTGLFDQYQYCDNRQALQILKGMASYFKKRLDKFNLDRMATILNATEEGGMCDVLWNLYSVTDNSEHRVLAIKFEKRRFITPMSLREDVLTGLHGNTHIPLVIGAERRYELTGNKKYRDMSVFFWDCVANKRCYATGGTTLLEVWPQANKLADTLGYRNQECCKTHNMLKVTRHLICWTADPKYADYYERALFNSILGTHDCDEGRLMYYIPLKTGFQKSVLSHSCHFYCCTGTGIESHSKFNDSIYFHDGNGIYVNLFIASALNWQDKGVQLEQHTNFPEKDSSAFVFHTSASVALDLNIHVPYWATKGVEVIINDVPQAVTAKPSSYLTITRKWSDGDRVDVRMPMSLHLHPMPDDPELMAIMYGPLVLAGITEPCDTGLPYIIACGKEFPEKDLHANTDFFLADPKKLDSWIKPVNDSPLTFRTIGQVRDITFVPFNRITGERYGVYRVVTTPGSPKHQQLLADVQKRKDEARAKERLAARRMDFVQVGNSESEKAHNYKGQNSATGPWQGENWRHATSGGWWSWDIKVNPNMQMELLCTYWGSDTGRIFDILADDEIIATQALDNNKPNEFFDVLYSIPQKLTKGKDKITVKFQAHENSMAGGIFECSMLKPGSN